MNRLFLFLVVAFFFCFATQPVFAQNEHQPEKDAPKASISSVEPLVISYSSRRPPTRFGPAAPKAFQVNANDAKNLPIGTVVIVAQGEAPGTPFLMRIAFVFANDGQVSDIFGFGKGLHYQRTEISPRHATYIRETNPDAMEDLAQKTGAKINYLDGNNEKYLRTLDLPDEKMLIALIGARAVDPQTSPEELEALLAPYFAYLQAQP